MANMHQIQTTTTTSPTTSHNNNNNNNSNNSNDEHSLTQLPMESIVHCLSFLHSHEIFERVIPVCTLFQKLTYTRQLWDFVYFCSPKGTDVSVHTLNKFPLRHIIISSKHFSITNLFRMDSGFSNLKSVILSFVSVDHNVFVSMLNEMTGVERLTLERCKIINYGGVPCESLDNEFKRLKRLELKGMQGDYLTKLKPLHLLVSRAKNVIHLTMKRNQPHLLHEIYNSFHPEMQLQSISIEEEHMFQLNQESHVLDHFFARHCSTSLTRLGLINCRNHFNILLDHCSRTLEQLLLVAVNWHTFSNEQYPALTSLARLNIISCASQVIEHILSDCVRESMLQIKLSSTSKSEQTQVNFISPKLKSFKSHYALPFDSISTIVLGCDRLECLEFGFAKRTSICQIKLQQWYAPLCESLMHLSIENASFDDQWWLLRLIENLKRLETLYVDTVSAKVKENSFSGIDSAAITTNCNLRVLCIEECDLTSECFDHVLAQCGPKLEQLSYDFSYDKTKEIEEKMASISKHCGSRTSLTVSCMDQVPPQLYMFTCDLPSVVFNVRDLTLEDILLLSIICDKAKYVEFNKDQGAINFGLVEPTEQIQSPIDSEKFATSVKHVIHDRIPKLTEETRAKLLNRYLSVNLDSPHELHQGSLRGLLKAIAVLHPS